MVFKNTGVKTMAKILIYYPSNRSSNVIETIAEGLLKKGNSVALLTQSQKGELHFNFETMGLKAESIVYKKNWSLLYYFKHIFYLVIYCKKNQIVAIQSHLQQANIVAVIAQFFIRSKVVICRHHLTEQSKMSNFFDKLINKFAKLIIVPSQVIQHKLIIEDKVNASKVKLIPYVYDFTRYPEPNLETVHKLKNLYKAKLLVLLCGRFVPLKRNDIVVLAVKKLIEMDYDVKLIALDEGPGLSTIKDFVYDNNLQNFIHFAGYQKNIMDYFAACDVLVHPSYSEASNNSVKEAGILSKVVIVCSNVGDFSDYIIHKKNGYLVDKENPLEEIIDCLKEIYNNLNSSKIGDELKKTVYEKFHQSEVIINLHEQVLCYN